MSMLAAAFLLLAPLAQAPQDPAATEAKARADLAHAAQHLDQLLLHGKQAQDRAKAALELVRATEAAAKQSDRARLTKLAADLGAQLASLDAAIATHAESLRTLRLAIDIEIPPAAEGSVPWFRERAVATEKLPTHAEVVTALRAIERDVQADRVKKQPGADGLLSHVRYLLAEAVRQEAEALARDSEGVAHALGKLGDAAKKFDEVLQAPDVADTGLASSLHALALRRQVEIEAKLYLTYQPLVQRKPDLATKANLHRKRANDAFARLQRAHAAATMPSGELVVEAARASVERLGAR